MGSQSYDCKNKHQCLSGGSFEAAPEEWFTERSLELPKTCKPCKENGIRITETYQCENTHCIGGRSFEEAPKEVFIKNGRDFPTRCKPCIANEIWNTQTYVCKNKGCTGDRNFEERIKKHWDDLGANLPANCPKCKEWIEAQKRLGKITLSCFVCAVDWTVSAERRISHHRNDGKWDASASGINLGRPCGSCERNPYCKRLARERLAEWRYASFPRSDDRDVDKINAAQMVAEKKGFLNSATSFDVSMDPAAYAALINTGRDVKHGKNELEHIMKVKHCLKALGTNDPHVLLQIVGALAKSTDPTNIMQCRSGSNIMKADIETGLVVILTQYRAPAGQWRIRTTYMSDNLEKYVTQYAQSWRQMT